MIFACVAFSDAGDPAAGVLTTCWARYDIHPAPQDQSARLATLKRGKNQNGMHVGCFAADHCDMKIVCHCIGSKPQFSD